MTLKMWKATEAGEGKGTSWDGIEQHMLKAYLYLTENHPEGSREFSYGELFIVVLNFLDDHFAEGATEGKPSALLADPDDDSTRDVGAVPALQRRVIDLLKTWEGPAPWDGSDPLWWESADVTDFATKLIELVAGELKEPVGEEPR